MTSYTKQTWVNGSGGGTPVSAARLGVLETGVSQAVRAMNVLDYGAVGDGTTDCSTAIQAAVDAVPQTGSLGDTIYFPPGIYKCVTKINLNGKKGLHFLGPGSVGRGTTGQSRGAQIITGTASMILFESNNAGTSTVHEGPRWENINMRDAAGGSTLISLNNCNRWGLFNCALREAAVGLKLDATNYGTGEDCAYGELYANYWTDITTAIDIRYTQGFCLVGGESAGCSTTIDFNGPAGGAIQVRVIGLKTDGGNPMFKLGTSAYGAHFIACDCEVNSTPNSLAFQLNSGANQNQIIGCSMDGANVAGQKGIEINAGATGTVIMGVRYGNLGTNFSDAGTRTLYLPCNTGGPLTIPRFQTATASAESAFEIWNNNAQVSMFQANESGLGLLLKQPSAYPSIVMRLGTDTSASKVAIQGADTNAIFTVQGDDKIGYFGTTPVAKPTVSGSRGANAALASLLTALASYGLIVDSSS